MGVANICKRDIIALQFYYGGVESRNYSVASWELRLNRSHARSFK